ncbi:hypothetical protein [Peribacillus acanthi]|uniref:hypothetical protein n=1 Tax=Peribacillus acanthi TaxID=2171554 RepID=UPI000D3E56A0|nr:hypothetical protein [Peribacillus acanthi]
MAIGDKMYLGYPSFDNHCHYNQSIGTAEVVITLPFQVTNFKYISNDDPTNDLIIAFNTGTTADSGSGLNGVITLKGGETLSDFNKKATVIKFKRTAGTGNVRVLGV